MLSPLLPAPGFDREPNFTLILESDLLADESGNRNASRVYCNSRKTSLAGLSGLDGASDPYLSRQNFDVSHNMYSYLNFSKPDVDNSIE